MDEPVLWVVSDCELAVGQIRHSRVEVLVRSYQEVNEGVVLDISFLGDRLDVLQGIDRVTKVSVLVAPVAD